MRGRHASATVRFSDRFVVSQSIRRARIDLSQHHRVDGEVAKRIVVTSAVEVRGVAANLVNDVNEEGEAREVGARFEPDAARKHGNEHVAGAHVSLPVLRLLRAVKLGELRDLVGHAHFFTTSPSMTTGSETVFISASSLWSNIRSR